MGPLSTGILLGILRGLMLNETFVGEPLSAYIVPNASPHLTGGLAICEKRLAFLSDYTGSAGTAIISAGLSPEVAALWTDGRYFAQAEEQLDPAHWTLMKQGEPGVPTQAEWLKASLPPGARVGVDPKLYSQSSWEALSSDLASSGMTLVPVQENLVDLTWTDRPECLVTPAYKHPLEFAGRSTQDKLADIRKDMQENGAEFLVLSELDQISWTLNVRAFDYPYSINFKAFMIIGGSGSGFEFELFRQEDQLNDGIIADIIGIGGILNEYNNVYSRLAELASSTQGKIWLSKNVNHELVNSVPEARRIIKLTPVSLLKSLKNDKEIQGMFDCHVRDGAALVQFLAWAEEELNAGTPMTELSASDKLREYRSALPYFEELSFQAIMASGAHAAIIHYMPTESTNIPIDIEEILLVDSGGLYFDGITDVTRTLHFREPTKFQKEAYTRVLKGQIAVKHSYFIEGRKSHFLDSVARQFLWQVGLNYNHGTGHGMAAVWPSIQIDANPDDPGLFEGMFNSNEPGYYEDGSFGIRLENVVVTVKAETVYQFGNRTYLTYDDVTFVPMQIKMINIDLLTPPEIEYLNEYHRKCREITGVYLRDVLKDERAYQWLLKETEPIGSTKPDQCPGNADSAKASFAITLSLIYLLKFLN